MTVKVKRLIGVYRKDNDEHVGNINLPDNIELSTLQNMFNVPKDNPMYDCAILEKEHLPFFEKNTGEKFDLDKYEYSLECYADRS